MQTFLLNGWMYFGVINFSDCWIEVESLACMENIQLHVMVIIGQVVEVYFLDAFSAVFLVHSYHFFFYPFPSFLLFLYFSPNLFPSITMTESNYICPLSTATSHTSLLLILVSRNMGPFLLLFSLAPRFLICSGLLFTVSSHVFVSETITTRHMDNLSRSLMNLRFQI